MNLQLVSIETAKMLRDIGYNEPCAYFYVMNFHNFKETGIAKKWNNDPINLEIYTYNTLGCNQPHLCPCPTLYAVKDWFYKIKNRFISISIMEYSFEYRVTIPADPNTTIPILSGKSSCTLHQKRPFKTPEEALEQAIQEACTTLNIK